jgi:hypothetical protein
MGDGFTKIRNGIDDHLRDGTISLFESAVFVQMLRQAQYDTGLWFGNAERLLADAPRNTTLQDCRNALKHLSQLGWIKGWRRGHEGATVVYLIDRFECTEGAAKGMRLNLEKTKTWKKPFYEDAAEAQRRCSVGVAVAQRLNSDCPANGGTIQNKYKNKHKKGGKEKIGKDPLLPATSRNTLIGVSPRFPEEDL